MRLFVSMELLSFELTAEGAFHSRFLSLWWEENNSSLFEIYLGPDRIYIDILYSWFFYSLTMKVLDYVLGKLSNKEDDNEN